MKTPLALLALLPLVSCSSNEVEIDPEKQLELYMTTATYLYQDGSLIRAQDQAVKALEIEPDNRPMRRMVGWIRLRLGSTEDLLIAERFFQDLFDDGDDDAPVLLGLATAQERLGQAHDEASRAIASGERFTEHEDPERRATELAQDARGYWQRSHENYERVLAGPTQIQKALNGLLRVAAHLGDYEEALDWGRQLLETSHGEQLGWEATLRAEDLTQSEEDVARESIVSAVDLQIETHLFCTSILHRLGRTPEALEHVRDAVAIDPERADAYGYRAQLFSETGRFDAAIEDLDKFLRLSDKPFEHADIRKAYDLRAHCESQLAGATALSEG
ncbi:MAG: tetratricopeptide repeat protein [Planctomycetota bacterium]